MIKFAIVICSRLKSNRLPKKAHLKLEGKTVISHLVNNLIGLQIPIIVTVPQSEFHDYRNDESFPKNPMVIIHNSEHEEDPLARTHQVAKQFNIENVIRITHDKIFIDTFALMESLDIFIKQKADYLYTSNLIPGTNFEVIKYGCLKEAAMKYKNVEYISYAVRTTSLNTINFNKENGPSNIKGLNLLLDYEEDFKLFQIIYSILGVNANFSSVVDLIYRNPWMIDVNKKPLVSVYTCAFNSDSFIHNAIQSVKEQSIYKDIEYIMIDDHSTDKTFAIMAKESMKDSRISYYRNEANMGLSTSSNIALKKAKGKFIIRIDSDDYFSHEKVLEDMVDYINHANAEIIYPDNYNGSYDLIQKGKECNHVGGAMFNKNALNFIKFTDGLRGYEGYDLFLRAKDRLKIAYYEKPCFFYTKRQGSLSTMSPKFRDKIKKEIEVRVKSNEKT